MEKKTKTKLTVIIVLVFLSIFLGWCIGNIGTGKYPSGLITNPDAPITVYFREISY